MYNSQDLIFDPANDLGTTHCAADVSEQTARFESQHLSGALQLIRAFVLPGAALMANFNIKPESCIPTVYYVSGAQAADVGLTYRRQWHECYSAFP